MKFRDYIKWYKKELLTGMLIMLIIITIIIVLVLSFVNYNTLCANKTTQTIITIYNCTR